MTGNGFHIVFEGPDAAGKSTQITLLQKHLLDLGYNVTTTFEPGGTVLGAKLREILLGSDLDIDYRAEALLMAADRAQDVNSVILPAMNRGDIVISDRYIPSSLVYQGVLRGLGIKEIYELNRFAVGDHQPDLILCFDIDDEIAKQRASDTPDRIEREGTSFHQKIRDTYRQLSLEFSWSVVDANGSEQVVFARIIEYVESILKRVR